MGKEKTRMYILMTALIIVWGLDYIAAKICLDSLETFIVLFFRYTLALGTIWIIKMVFDRRIRIRRRDVPLFLLCALTGELGYYYLEYSAIGYLPLSLLTLVLACVPIVSLAIERIAFGRRITPIMGAGVAGSLLGVALIIGADFRILMEGRLTGYLLAFGAVLSWNAYNFITARLQDNYTDVSLACYQITCTTLLMAPYALRNLPPAEQVSTELVLWIAFIGVLSVGIGFVIYIRSLDVIGVTPTSLFVNFLPVTTTLFGWLFFGETITPLQVVGGIVIVAAACVVIREKGRVDASWDERADMPACAAGQEAD